ncbi:Protein of unknown function [Amycolatopsis arida]|uniref:DUF3017 domain-containing protein n=1 Tax=Amycolatopsis arida TaxID=587909 RepID=A0A1I5WVJ1_9PSEU|nr:DUF3017 domain-containing protein [Amycolatopsis arida]TDX92472.1 Protein of unknown function (DUF3017) [Amycolatopsis arida]SFQ23700.1 Protein of unknown function [Amycolatopsis arida]
MTPPHKTPPRDRHPALTHLPFALVLVLVAIAAVRIGQYHWRQGTALIGGALLVAAVLRAALSDEQAGLLAIRGRAVDVLSYVGLGVLILFVALTISGGLLG